MAKSTDCGCACSRLSFRRASSLRFLNASSEAAVWPFRPREVEIFVQSTFKEAERCALDEGDVS